MGCVGVIQMTSGPDPFENINWIEAQTESLVSQGAQWIVTPENAIVFGSRSDYHQYAESLGDGVIQQKLASIAKRYRIWLVIGSMPIQTKSGVTTTTLIFDDFGSIVAHYDKLHMFDVDVADGHQRYRESDTFTPGNRVVTAETPFAHLGLSICYDVRFPHLYSQLVREGAQVMLVPAAFTAVTGEAHWETLLRCRAIETQSWVVAVGQGGTHPCGRETWGHSMVIDPWGRIVKQLDQTASSMVVDIDLTVNEQVRRNMPIERHTRFNNHFQINNKS